MRLVFGIHIFVLHIHSSVLAQSTRIYNLRWSICKYTLFLKVKITYLYNQCIFVRQEQSLHNTQDISESDNISNSHVFEN